MSFPSHQQFAICNPDPQQRFIYFSGELFKQKMLTPNIMMHIMATLLKNKDEESLKCVCVLLMTVGQELETKKDISHIFNILQEYIEERHGRLTSRIKFILQEVINMRKNHWVKTSHNIYQF